MVDMVGSNLDVSRLEESISKTNERIDKMAKVIIERERQILSIINDNSKDRVYIVRPTQTEKVGALALALSKAQKEMGGVARTGSGNRGSFASMIDFEEAANPILEKYELSVAFQLDTNEYGEFVLRCKLMHSSDQWLENTVILHEDKALNPGDKIHAKVAAAEKSLRRYMFRAILNLAEDDE